MGKVIQATFGNEREWEDTRAKMLNSLLTFGALFGDDEPLLRAKADCLYRMLRRIVEEVPRVTLDMKVPETLTEQQIDIVTVAAKEATLRGIEVALTHAIQVMMASAYDLCTSKLAHMAS